MKSFKYRDTVCLEHALYDLNGEFWSKRNSNKRFGKYGSLLEKRPMDSLQRTVVSTTIRKVLQPEN